MSSFRDLVKKVNAEGKNSSSPAQKQSANTGGGSSSFRDLVNKVNSGAIQVGSKLDTSTVDEWYRSVSSVADRAYQYLQGSGYKKPNDDFSYEIDKYLEQSRDVEQYLRANKSGFSDYDSAMKGYYDAVNYLRSLKDGLSSSNRYYSQFSTEDEYQTAVEQAKADATIWEELNQDPEFGAKSGYVSTQADGWWDKMTSQYGMGYTDLTYEYINNQGGIRDDINRKSQIYRGDTKDGTSSFGENHYDFMNDQEVSIYNYYYAQYGREKAEEYLDSIGGRLESRANNQTVENVTEFAGEHPWLSSALSIGTSLGSGVEYLGDVIEYGKDKVLGKPARLGTNEAALITNTVRGTVSEAVDWEIGNWDAFDFLYSTAMSGADSLVAGTMFGGLGGTVLGLSAAAQGTNDALARGMSNGQAFWNGLISGVFEGLFETISIGNFNKLKEVAPDSVKSVFKNLGKSMLVNASEEALTEIANIGYDTLINGEFANYTWEELKNGAWKDALAQVVEAGASGALMGVGMSGIGNAIGYYNGSREAKQLYGESQQELVGEALEINPDNAFAQKMQGRLDIGKDLSGGQLNRLVQQNQAAITAQDMATIQSAAESRLTELGETGDVATIAAALTKQAAGQKLTRAEQQMIAGSKYGQRVSNELNTENINSGDYSSDWAQKLDTNRINAEEYSRFVEAAQLPQETAETTGSQIATQIPKAEQAAQVAPVEAPAATVRENRTVPANDQQMTGKLTGKESLQVAEETSVTEEPETKAVTLEDASKKYGAQAQAMIHTYQAGQDVEKFDQGYQVAYDMGKSGVAFSYLEKSPSVSYLTDSQKQLAYEAGSAASETAAKELDAKNKAAANGKTGRKKGVVRGEGVTIADLKQTFNDTQGKAYRYLSTVAEVTGIDIVLYRSEADPTGKFQGAQGRYRRSEPGTIYIDLNAGLSDVKSADDLAKYAMLRTFSHEFTHFLEKWNPIHYNEFRKVVFDTLTQRGENVHDLIEGKQAQTPGMSYDAASREVVAEAMTDILPDVNFVQELAQKHKNIFTKLIEKLKEFVNNLRDYYNSIGHNRSKEANALKEQVGETAKYLDSVVKLFDHVAVEAVESYQKTVAIEDHTDGGIANGTEREAQRTETLHGGREAGISENGGGAREEAGDRSGVSEEVGTRQENPASERQHRRLKTGAKSFVKEDYVDPPEGSALYRTQKAFQEYDIECHIVKASAWEHQSMAYAYKGIVYISEQMNADMLDTVVPHEVTHVMKQNGFRPYLDFIEKTPDFINMQTESWVKLIKAVSNHRGADVFDLDDTQLMNLYDELNCTVYGMAKGGILDNSEYDYGEWVPGAFYDFDGYIRELDSIHAQYKTQFGAVQTVADVAEKTPVRQDAYTNLADQLKQYTHVDIDGIRYSAKAKKEGGYYGNIKRLPAKAGGVPVENARGTIYSSYTPGFATREEAIADLVAVAKNNKLLGEVQAAETTKPKEEVTNHGENADNPAAVPQHEPDGRGAARLLDEVEAENVQGDGGSGNSVGSAAERRPQAGRDGDLPDSQRPSGGSSEGSGQSGDLRGPDRVTTEESAEKLHEEVVEQVEQQSTEKPKGRNFVIGDSLDLPSGEKARYKANVEAIRLVKKLEAEGRYATDAEQVILSKYVGWGGLANAFDQRKTEWSKEFAELKELLTDEEYSSARGSTLNAHYTDISVIKAMYDGLKQLGFIGGRMMEPSSGVGNFVGAMPGDMAAQVKSWTMVELDGITGLIAKYLYPNADVRIQGFEKAKIPDNFMDVAISNVPFGNYAIADKSYPKKVTSAIHNYFFAKSLDKVRPGGIVMFITSSYTMNSKDSTVRRYIMQKADLLGAIRLPDNAFKGNAGTEVVTDILILKKRAANTAYAGEDFLEAPYKYISGYNGAYINSYFDNHPEMVLGTASMEGGMYRGDNLTYKAFTDRGSLAEQIRGAFQNIQGKMEYPAKMSPEKTNFAVERAGKKTKENGFVVKDGKVYKNTGGELIEQNVSKGIAERIAGMLEIRDAAKALQNAQQQGLKDTEIKKARQKLNKVYDAFVKKNGFINAQANKNAIMDDPDRYSILALENWNPETKKATKSDIFSKNTIAPNRTVTSAKDVAEGLIVSVNQTGGVDAALIAKLTGKTEAEVTRELLDSRAVFKNRDGELETAEKYLSGNVRAKLRDAEGMVSLDADYQKNVEALSAVVPEDVGYQDIFVNPGTPWIPDSVYSDFAAHMLGTANHEWNKAVDVTRNKDTGNFTVELKNRYLKTNSYNTQKWGTSRRSFLDLFDAMLNSKSVVVKYKTDDGKTVVDQDATAAANEKVEAIQKEFQEWLWKDENRRTELASLYNETFNSIVTPKYNGDNLTVNGANAMKPLRPHQRNAVQRIISSGGNTLLAHKVGAGKTYEMAAAAMKLKELGLVKKPLFAVPKSLVAQWGNEFVDFFPTAKLLVAEASDFTAANRKIFANRIANGEYDAVIVSYEQFEKLPISADFAKDLYQEQIDSIILAIEEAKAEKGGKSLSVKDLEKKRKTLQTKIEKLTDTAKDEDNIEFEQLGVDSIFVDEAHNFKNLFYTTSMTNVSGLGNKDGSKRAFDLYTKVRYLQKLNGGRGIVFATATPVMNSMSEMYIMQKYLQPDLLDQLGLSTFDAWAKQFGEVVNGVEIKPSGQGYRVKQSFSRFKNMSELQLLFRNFADVLTDIPGLKIPKMKGGKVNVVVCEPGQFQQDYMKELEKRADNIKNVDPSEDNMLKITSDGRKISYTQRMIDPSLPYEEGCKIFRCADNVVRVYQDSKEVKGTQLIFCDMATPKGKSKAADTQTEEMETDMESAKLYDDIKARLMKGGIPAKEIAFIHEADTDAKKKKLFADVNDGKVRVLIGSTGKMGVGMNAQKRIVAIHHLDAPWRPGDVEQRNGRAYRQGNINDEVENFTYVTEGSFDARLWDILDRKQSFINQVMNGENVGRETEDTGEVTLSAAEVKALASGSPLIMEQVQLDTDIKKLESLRRAHRSAVTNAISRLERDKGRIATLEKMIENGKADTAARVDTYSEGKFSITVGKQKFSDKKDAGIALMAEATAKANEDGYTTVAQFAGFDLRVVKTHEGIKGLISGKQGYSFNTYPSNTTYMINHLVAKVEEISEAVTQWEKELTATRKDMAEQEQLINQPFAKQAELEQKRARYNEVMEILNPKEEQQLSGMDEESTQEQSRESLQEDEQYQQRTDTLTDRDVLAMAASQVTVADLTAAEKDALDIFQQRLSKLEALQTERAEQGRLYKEQQFGTKVDRVAAAKTLNRMHTLDDQIQKASADVLTVEEKTVLKRVLQKARTVVEQQEREHGQEILKRWRDRRNNAEAIKKYRERIRGDVDELTNWVLHPDNKSVVKHIPDALKSSVIPFLSSINFMSKRQLKGGNATAGDKAFMEQLRRLAKVMENTVDVDEMYANYNDLPPDFMRNLRSFMDTAQAIADNSSGEYIINQMTSEELQNLSKVVRTLKKYIMQMNRFHVNAMFRHVYDAGDNSIDFMGQMNPAGNTGGVSNFLLWQQMRPAYAFERFGDGGKAIYDGLRRGQATLAFNTRKITEFSEKAYTTAEVRAWEKQVKTIRLGEDKTIQMRVSQIMSLYELSKREQAQGHIFGEGIRVATFKNGKQKISDVGQTITPEELNTILQTLTPRQKEVADSLQQFMQKQGGEWGNYVTVARFGEKQFGEENYFPINSDGRHLSVDADEKPGGAALYALLNMGFTKQTQEKAKNRLIVYSIFDVFSNHMASMAQYNAFALPVIDALKWFNYQQIAVEEDGSKTILGSVREQMDRVYGVPEESRPGSGRRGYAQNFVIGIIKAFNGTEAQGTPYDGFGMNPLHRYNRAQVAYNFRVVVQQPLAITRAAQILDYASIIKGMKLSPAAVQKNIQEMRKYSGIAAWKSLGFYDVNISRGLSSIIKHDDTALDKITDVGMWGAEKADTLTWAAMWSAAKEEVIRKHKLTPKSEGFYEAVTKLFEDVIYKTQVVDSVLTKNEFMRDKGLFARAVGSFMSEPSTTASMLLDAYDKFQMDMQRGMTRQQAWKKNGKMIARTAYVYGIGAAILAAVQAVADAFRDDDDYQEFMEKWLEAFGGNLVDEVMPFNKLPVLSDVYDLAKELLSVFGVDTYGNPPQSVFMQWYDSLVKGTEIIYGRITGDEDRYTWYGGAYKLLQAASGIVGLPMAGATREIVTAWNNTVGAMAPSLKIKTYDPGEKNEIKYAYQDGYLTDEEAMALLVEKGLVDTEDEAYFTIQGWEAGSGYSRYDAIFDAVRNNGDISETMRELTSRGYKEKEVFSQVKEQIGKWYTGGEITKQQAINMLTRYFDMDSDEITSTVNKWSSKVVTGIAFGDIKDEYLSGNITADRAIDMYVRYGGYSKDKAAETVTKWRAEKETGIAYDDIKDAFMDGEISAGDAKNMYVTYGGYSEQEAAEKVTVLAFVKQYPETDGISYAAIESFHTYCEAYGVSAGTFYNAWKYNSSIKADVDDNGESISGSKKVKVLAYIHGLDLTNAQKDGLYYAFGWAESKIHEAPWH